MPQTRRSILAASAAILAMFAATPASVGARQIGAGVLASFKDLETWSRYDEAAQATERGLGLVLAGSGDTRLAFVARYRGRAASGRPETMAVQISRGARADPHAIPPIELKFTLDAGTPRQAVIDLSGRAVSYPVGAGVVPTSVTAPIAEAQLQRLAGAASIDVQVIGVGSSLAPAQLRALQAFAGRGRTLTR
jgi:hypothetical protein